MRGAWNSIYVFLSIWFDQYQCIQSNKSPLSDLNVKRRIRKSKEHSEILDSATSLPAPRSDLTTTLGLCPNDEGDLKIGIFLIGGCNQYNDDLVGEEECEEVTNNMWVYEPYDDIFIERADMPRARFRHLSASIDGDTIWVLAGRDQSHHLIPEIDIYTPQSDSWMTLPVTLPPDLLISDGAVFAHGSDLFVAGGYNAQYEATGSTFVIDTRKTLDTGQLVYEILEPMGTPRGDISAILFGRDAYVAGGFTHRNGFCAPLRTVEIFDVVKREWSSAPSFNIARGDVSLVSFNDRIFAIGGETTHLSQNAPSCRSRNTNYRKRLVAKTYPVNSIEVFLPNENEDRKHENAWELAYSQFLPQNNEVFRFVANAFPEMSVIYAFGGVLYDGGDSQTGPEKLITSDKVTLYLDDFKHGRFYGRSFGVSNRGWNYLVSNIASITVIFSGISILMLTCGVFAYRKYRKRRENQIIKEQTNFRFHMGGDAVGLVEIQ